MTPSNLRTVRQRKLLTQAELARRAGVTVRTINRLEQGTHQPKLVTKRNILRALGMAYQSAEVIWPSSAE